MPCHVGARPSFTPVKSAMPAWSMSTFLVVKQFLWIKALQGGSSLPSLTTETLTEKGRASHFTSELCAALDSGFRDFGVGYTDEVANVDAADGAMKLGHFYVCKACSSSPDKTRFPEKHFLVFFLFF